MFWMRTYCVRVLSPALTLANAVPLTGTAHARFVDGQLSGEFVIRDGPKHSNFVRRPLVALKVETLNIQRLAFERDDMFGNSEPIRHILVRGRAEQRDLRLGPDMPFRTAIRNPKAEPSLAHRDDMAADALGDFCISHCT